MMEGSAGLIFIATIMPSQAFETGIDNRPSRG
jgi:hypothetical protein